MRLQIGTVWIVIQLFLAKGSEKILSLNCFMWMAIIVEKNDTRIQHAFCLNTVYYLGTDNLDCHPIEINDCSNIH